MNFGYMKDFLDRLTEHMVPGNSIVVYKDAKEVFRYSSGFSDLENKVKMTGDEYINIYSCSKVATVTAALQLYEKGWFLLDDPLWEYIPEYREMTVRNSEGLLEKAKNTITIRHLFTMTAGLTYNMNTENFEKAKKLTHGKMNTLTVAKCIAGDPLQFEPGTHWGYSLCHDVLAAVVEVVSGEKFRDYVKKNIFAPLGMNNSVYHPDASILSDMAEQYMSVNSDETDIVKLQSAAAKSTSDGYIKNVGKTNSHILGDEYDSGGAGVITTVGDYARLAAALANGGMGTSGERILAPGTVELLRTNQLNNVQLRDLSWSQLVGCGYGLGVRTTYNRAEMGYNGTSKSRGEFGWGGAAGATVIVDPDENFAAFYAHHMLNPREEFYQPRLRNVLYTCFGY